MTNFIFFVDLYLIHVPIVYLKPDLEYEIARKIRLESWQAMIDLYEEGKCRAIGVSNYMPRHIQEIIDDGLMTPMVHQFEYHPYYQNKEIIEYCLRNNIIITVKKLIKLLY